MTQAFRGGDALFLVTDFFTAKTMEKEYQQGKNAIDAAKEVCMQFCICLKCEQVVIFCPKWQLICTSASFSLPGDVDYSMTGCPLACKHILV